MGPKKTPQGPMLMESFNMIEEDEHISASCSKAAPSPLFS